MKKIVVDSQEGLEKSDSGFILDNNNEPIFVWCIQGRGKFLRGRRISLSVCLKYSKKYRKLYEDCQGCSIWHKYLPKDPEPVQARWSRIVIDEPKYKRIKIKKKYKRIKI